MFSSGFLTLILSALLAQTVTAQSGVTYVMSRDGQTIYPCPSIVEPETYYQDKCPPSTISGKSLIEADVRNTVGNPRDGGDWSITFFCFYGTGRSDYCTYTANKASPNLVANGNGLGADCSPVSSSVAYSDPNSPLAAPPGPSAAPVQSDGLYEPELVCPTSDGNLQHTTDLGFTCAYATAPYCFYDTYGVYNAGEGTGPSNCPSQLCANHYDPVLTRRSYQDPAISRRQVKAKNLRRASSPAVPQRSKRFVNRR